MLLPLYCTGWPIHLPNQEQILWFVCGGRCPWPTQDITLDLPSTYSIITFPSLVDFPIIIQITCNFIHFHTDKPTPCDPTPLSSLATGLFLYSPLQQTPLTSSRVVNTHSLFFFFPWTHSTQASILTSISEQFLTKSPTTSILPNLTNTCFSSCWSTSSPWPSRSLSPSLNNSFTSPPVYHSLGFSSVFFIILPP